MGRVETMKAKYGEDYFSKIGGRGGKAKVKKGIATLSPKERKKMASEAANKRWENERAKNLY